MYAQTIQKQTEGMVGNKLFFQPLQPTHYALAMDRKQHPFYVFKTINFTEKNYCFRVQSRNTVFGAFLTH